MSYSAGGGAGAIATLTDSALNTPAQGQYLGYNTSTQKWTNQARPMQLTENVTLMTPTATVAIPDTTVSTINTIVLNRNVTFTFPTAAAGKSFMVVVNQDSTGGRTVTWPTQGSLLYWPGATVPTLSTASAATDIFSFICVDGSTWFGFTAGLSF